MRDHAVFIFNTAANQKCVIFIVFNHKNFFHTLLPPAETAKVGLGSGAWRSVFGQATKNLLPLSSSDSTHKRPPFSSTIFLTILRPIPLPSTFNWLGAR